MIPTFRRRDLVLRTVAALGSQTFTRPFEVVVVVDGSQDGSAEALRALSTPFPVVVVEQANSGAPAARNRGAERAGGELLLFLDDDMEADPDMLEEHDRSHHDGADLVLGHMPLHPDSPPTFLSRAVGRWAEERMLRLSEPGVVPGVRDRVSGQMSISSALFRRVNGFTTTFIGFGNADLEFGLRVAETGARVVFNPRAISRQLYVVTPRRYLRQRRQQARNDLLFARKRPELTELLLGDASETLWERTALRALRPLLKSALLVAFAARPESALGIRWFSRVRRLEYLRGVREGGGFPARRRVRILCYHAVADGTNQLARYSVPPARFRAQIEFLRRHFRFISGEELMRLLDGVSGVPRRAVLLTFDDGYRDLLTAAAPVLAAHTIPAVAFVVTQRLGSTSDWGDRRGAPLIDEHDLGELHRLGVAIGSHTRTHPRLTRVGDEQAREELAGSLADLALTGSPFLPLLAYPHGLHDDGIRRASAVVGYQAAFTVEPGLVDPQRSDRWALPRIEVLGGDRGLLFWWKVCRPRRRRR